ncbi:hypothetical protein N0V88_008161 [Collariella sp. IMI 366227]|nr:hypothetical protein N0V88_008161 [Collariella sp. IMI 366227]
MPKQLLDLHTIAHLSFPYIFEQNVTIYLSSGDVVRCNVYRPKTATRVPVLVTFTPKFAEVNPEHKSAHSAWETPDPGYWTKHGYAVVRADEVGSGQSPGILDTMSQRTTDAFVEVIEWAADASWSSGKVGLLGISYYAGSHTIEGDLSEFALADNFRDQRTYNQDNQFLDQPYYSSREYDLADIEVPILSVGNWGGISLHLRGNIEGFTHASSKFKYLYMITGRHDLPFYYNWESKLQRSFLDAFLKDDDQAGWSFEGEIAGPNGEGRMKAYQRRQENEWPIARTQYTRFFLLPNHLLQAAGPYQGDVKTLTYPALGTIEKPQLLEFTTPPFVQETEITGHIVAHLNISISADPISLFAPSDMDLFLTLRHIGTDGKEVFYTGTVGDLVPLTKGWLRVSLRKINTEHPRHRAWLPRREYTSGDVLPVVSGEVYGVDVEVWPTNVVVQIGERIVFEVASGDTQGSGVFLHDDPVDRSHGVFHGFNHIHFGPQWENYVILPIIPPRE